jgi:TetR/AcrR family transcriptional regulator, regulator of autoinduction and epiphytic fitness
MAGWMQPRLAFVHRDGEGGVREYKPDHRRRSVKRLAQAAAAPQNGAETTCQTLRRRGPIDLPTHWELMSRQDFILKRAAEKRAAILIAARRRFAEDGLDGASVEQISREAHVSTATLYRQFPSKLTLFEAVLSDGLGAFEAALTEATVEQPAARLEQLAHAYAALLDDGQTSGLLRAVFAAAPATPAVAEIFYARVKLVVAGAFHRACAAAAQAGLIQLDAADPNAPGGRLMGMIEHPILWRRLLSNEPGALGPEHIAARALDAFWRAHAPP